MQNRPTAPAAADDKPATWRARLAPHFRRALMGAVAGGALMLTSAQLAAQTPAPEEAAPARSPAVALTEIGVLAGSYHTKSRGYYEGGVYKPYNEFNPGISAKFHIAAAPRFLRDVQVGFIARNSYGDPTTFIAFENTLLDSRHVKLTALTGIFPTGYTNRGPYDGIKPLVGLAAEGQGRLSVDTGLGRLKPYVMAMPGGNEVPVVLAAGVKMTFK